MAVLEQPWVLGTIAGITIFLGFPIARVRNLSGKTKAFPEVARKDTLPDIICIRARPVES